MSNKTITKQLYKAFLQLKTEAEVEAFCTDLMTPQEIETFAGRWAVAQELDKGTPQRKVSSLTGVSIATVTRVNRFLNRGAQGYRLVLDRVKNSLHHSPATRLAKAS